MAILMLWYQDDYFQCWTTAGMAPWKAEDGLASIGTPYDGSTTLAGSFSWIMRQELWYLVILRWMSRPVIAIVFHGQEDFKPNANFSVKFTSPNTLRRWMASLVQGGVFKTCDHWALTCFPVWVKAGPMQTQLYYNYTGSPSVMENRLMYITYLWMTWLMGMLSGNPLVPWWHLSTAVSLPLSAPWKLDCFPS